MPLTDEQRSLAAANVGLVGWGVKAAIRRCPWLSRWHDDVESAAGLALVDAARSFDPSRGTKLSTHYRWALAARLSGLMKEMRPKGYRLRADWPGEFVPTVVEMGDGGPLAGERAGRVESDPLAAMERREAAEAAVRAVRELKSPTQRETLAALFGLDGGGGMRATALARSLGASRALVGERKKAGLRSVRAALDVPAPPKKKKGA